MKMSEVVFGCIPLILNYLSVQIITLLVHIA